MKLTPMGTCQHFNFAQFYEFKTDSKEITALQGLEKREFVLACVMAGCEYLANIERVGLKVALKHFQREGSFAKVIAYLEKQKLFKERIPPQYVEKA